MPEYQGFVPLWVEVIHQQQTQIGELGTLLQQLVNPFSFQPLDSKPIKEAI